MGQVQRTAFVLIAAVLSACAQTRLQTPVVIQRKSTPTAAPGQLVFPDSANIDCVAANYATCHPSILQNNDSSGDLTLTNVTGSNTRLFFGSGGSVAGSDQFALWRGGVKRAELLPGGAFGSGRVQLGNTAGTFFTGFIADPAMATSAIYQLPGADGSSGDCLSTNGAATLSWVSCSGGGSTPPFVDTTNIIKGSVDATKLLRFEVDGFTTATTRTLTPQNASYTLAGIDLAQTFSAAQTYSSNILASGTPEIGSTATPFNRTYANELWTNHNRVCNSSGAFAQCYLWEFPATNVMTMYNSSVALVEQFDCSASPCLKIIAEDVRPYANNTYSLGTTTFKFKDAVLAGTVRADSGFNVGTSSVISSGRVIQNITGIANPAQLDIYTTTADLLTLGVNGATVAYFDTSGNYQPAVNNTYTNGTSARRWSTGYFTNINISGTCTGCPSGTVTSVTGTSPISSSGGTTPAISCSTCVTTAGGQSISGTTTLSTASISSALTGTFSMSGTQTVSGSMTIKSTSTAGNFYNRVVSDPSVVLSCSGVTDGWTAIVHDGTGGAPYWVVCDNTGTRYKVALTAY